MFDISKLTEEKVLEELERALKCSRRQTDQARALMHNCNFIDAEHQLQ